jgi:hypothetical protein
VIILLLTLLACELPLPSSSYAATLTVCASGCGYTTIAAAIGAASAGDTISIQDAVHNEANITVDRNLTIQGQGAANTAVDGGASGSVFVIDAGVTVTIQNVTIRNGFAYYGGGILNDGDGTVTISNSTISGNSTPGPGSGGGIFSIGTVTISNSTLSDNFAGDYGAGIFNGGSVTISNSTISGNSAPYNGSSGGGIFNSGTATISNSTVSGNSASGGGGVYTYGPVTIEDSTLSGNFAIYGSGGGIFNFFSTATVTNSTLSGNSSAGSGGGIWTYGTITVSFSTLSGNSSASSGGGIFNYNGEAAIKNSIVGNSSGGDCYGTTTAFGANLDTDGTCGNSNFTQVTSAQLNLGPLALNEPGTTETLALLSGSVAIDAAPDCTDVAGNPVTTDQRGVFRPQGPACDIGSFELIEVPLSKSDCKDGEWQQWTNPPFKNQGQCIKFVNHS